MAKHQSSGINVDDDKVMLFFNDKQLGFKVLHVQAFRGEQAFWDGLLSRKSGGIRESR